MTVSLLFLSSPRPPGVLSILFPILDSFHKFIHEASLSPHLNWSSLLFRQDSLSDEVIDHISTGKQYTVLEFSVFSAVPAQIIIPCIYWLLYSILPNALDCFSAPIKGGSRTSGSLYKHIIFLLSLQLCNRRSRLVSQLISCFKEVNGFKRINNGVLSF